MTQSEQQWMACMDDIRTVSWAFEQLTQATTMSQESAAYQRLFNAVSRLETWHPDYDYETGDIP